MTASSERRFGLSCRRIRPQLVGADHRSDSDELRDLLSIELSTFRQFDDDRADGDWSDAFDRVQDFDFAGVGLIGMLFLIHEIQDLPPSFDEHMESDRSAMDLIHCVSSCLLLPMVLIFELAVYAAHATVRV